LRIGRGFPWKKLFIAELDDWLPLLAKYKFEGRMHARSDGLMFGWTAPAAFFLPPHASADTVEIIDEFYDAPLADWPYQPWPAWADKDSRVSASHTTNTRTAHNLPK
jgi:hypothetical protein